ncbi:MAG: fumarylacetoacetate hydrolase family protein [Candidatus Marinimicrobia bacterium]|nr:fumarylacetoacetate hydrolase family protein [Candidatus Neomarinimicrobiota bacterium]MCH7764478.1 fumarylacetoacetate hydrolase family protein [Candidatus Neomarinimicrobiota bacterium]
MNYFNSRHETSIPISGSNELFLVHRIFCVGRNYKKHIEEMGYKESDIPFIFFMKPPEAVVTNGQKIAIPDFTNNFQHEVELVIAIGREGLRMSEENALEHVFGYGVGIDLTCRDIQIEAKKKGRPWTLAKSTPYSAPVSDITPANESGHLNEGSIRLSVNGVNRQKSNMKEMIRSVPKIVSEISEIYTLYSGDLIFTGTPEGVGKLEPGDTIFAEIDGLQSLTITIT